MPVISLPSNLVYTYSSSACRYSHSKNMALKRSFWILVFYTLVHIQRPYVCLVCLLCQVHPIISSKAVAQKVAEAGKRQRFHLISRDSACGTSATHVTRFQLSRGCWKSLRYFVVPKWMFTYKQFKKTITGPEYTTQQWTTFGKRSSKSPNPRNLGDTFHQRIHFPTLLILWHRDDPNSTSSWPAATGRQNVPGASFEPRGTSICCHKSEISLPFFKDMSCHFCWRIKRYCKQDHVEIPPYDEQTGMFI